MSETDKTAFYRALIQIAEHIESLGLGCIVVDNPFRGRSRNSAYSYCFIFTQPDVTKNSLSKQDFGELLQQTRKSGDRMAMDSGFWPLSLGLGPAIGIDSLANWLKFLEKNNQHPILSGDVNFGSTDIFLSKVIYGFDNQRAIVRAFQMKYGPNFIQDCYDTFMREHERRQKVGEDFSREIELEAKERQKPLNRYEVAEVKEFLRECLKIVRQYNIAAIVGIERSGRPLAIMFHQLLKELGYSPLPFVEFLDVHQLRKAVAWVGPGKMELPDSYVEVFKQEFPQLFQVLAANAQMALFIDDQVYSYWHTFGVVQQLVRQITGKGEVKILFEFVSPFNGWNGLTWWKDKTLLRIGSNENCDYPTLKAPLRRMTPEEEVRISEFENKLTQMVLELSQKISSPA